MFFFNDNVVLAALLPYAALLLSMQQIVVCYASFANTGPDVSASAFESSSSSDKPCFLPESESMSDVAITRTVHKQGFHRNIVTNISSDLNPSCKRCSFLLVERIPEGMYVDTNQLKTMQAFGSPQVLTFEEIDAEKPEYLSPNHTIYVYLDYVQPASGQLTASIDLPVHLRYHLPSDDPDVQHASIYLPPPDVFLHHCTDCSTIKCSSQPAGHVTQAPCTADNHSLCSWRQLSYKDSEVELEFVVPVGQASQSIAVTTVTLAAILIGTVALIWTMATTNHSAWMETKQR